MRLPGRGPSKQEIAAKLINQGARGIKDTRSSATNRDDLDHPADGGNAVPGTNLEGWRIGDPL